MTHVLVQWAFRAIFCITRTRFVTPKWGIRRGERVGRLLGSLLHFLKEKFSFPSELQQTFDKYEFFAQPPTFSFCQKSRQGFTQNLANYPDFSATRLFIHHPPQEFLGASRERKIFKWNFVCSLLLPSCANKPHLLPKASLNFLSHIRNHHFPATQAILRKIKEFLWNHLIKWWLPPL